MSNANFPKFIILLILCNVLPSSFAVLKVGFYVPTCPKAETIVRQLVQARFASDKSITAALLRMHFHDCFVRGCDASILLDSTLTRTSEKEAGPNLTVRGFELIDQIKAAIETACPNTVSCSDIVTLATRDAVALAGGPTYAVPTGRRDGLVSNAAEVNLPGPDFTVAQARRVFTSKGLTLSDMVTLLGAHTVGVAHCSFFLDRLTNFQGTGLSDPTMSPVLVNKLTTICDSLNGDPTVFLDQNTSFVFDNEFYHQLQLKKGILKIDQELALDASSAGIALAMARNASGFKQSFASAMIKLGGIQVLVGSRGQIRKNCRVVNPKQVNSPPPPKPISSPPPPPPKLFNSPPPPPIKTPSPPPPPKLINSPPPPPIKTPSSLPPPKLINSPPPPSIKTPSPPPSPKTVSSPPKQSSSPPPPLKL